MSTIVQKFKSFWFGPADNYDREDFEDLFETSDDVYATNGQLALEKAPMEPVMKPTRGSGQKVVDHPSAAAASEVLVIEPRQFEESIEIVEHLRSRKSVLLISSAGAWTRFFSSGRNSCGSLTGS